jgi:restriction system protein
MECLGPQCAAMLLDWLKARAVADTDRPPSLLWSSTPYEEDRPLIRTESELAGALEHLEYAVFRRYENQLTRAERVRLDNTIQNALFKVDRFLERFEGEERARLESRCLAIRDAARDGRDRLERLRLQARRAELKLSQLDSLSPEGFEEFVAELFEALGYDVERVGGTGDEGIDLRVRRGGLLCVVQCKYHKGRGVIGSPDLQKFLGSVHHDHAHKGFYVTTRFFSLAAERFASDHPIELVDGPRLVELVQEAMGPGARRGPNADLFETPSVPRFLNLKN